MAKKKNNDKVIREIDFYNTPIRKPRENYWISPYFSDDLNKEESIQLWSETQKALLVEIISRLDDVELHGFDVKLVASEMVKKYNINVPENMSEGEALFQEIKFMKNNSTFKHLNDPFSHKIPMEQDLIIGAKWDDEAVVVAINFIFGAFFYDFSPILKNIKFV